MRLIHLVDKCGDGRANYIPANAREQREVCIMVTTILL